MNVSTVAILRGGPSSEYDISMKTGECVLKSLALSSVTTKDIVITRSGQWLVDGFVRQPEQALVGVDTVFIALHGEYGEDGTVQRLLDRFCVPYTGSSSYASAIAMNKETAKNHLQAIGVCFPKHMRITNHGVKDPFQTALSISHLFGPKYIVKPTSGGSSIGTKIAQNPHELGSVMQTLLQEYDDLLVEEYIQGREVTVGVLENFREQSLYHLPVVEIIPPEDAGFFAAEVKYTGETQEICPGRFKKEEKEKMATIAQEVHKVLNLRHYSRSDFIVTPEDIYFLEVNTLPGLTPQSLFPKSIEAVGSSYQELIEHLIKQASISRV